MILKMSSNFNLPTHRPVVTIFSEPNSLALSLVENLLSNFCNVNIVGSDYFVWKSLIKHLEQSGHVIVFNLDNYLPSASNYVVSFGDHDIPDEIIRKTSNINNSKTITLLPIKNTNNKGTSSLNIYYGDLLGPRMDFREGLSSIIKDILTTKTISINTNENYYPTFIPDLSKEIVKIMFSFGPPAENISIYSEKLSALDIHKLLLQKFPNRVFVLKDGKKVQENQNEVVLKTQKIIDGALNETFGWFAAHPPSFENKQKEIINTPTIEGPVEVKPKVQMPIKKREWAFPNIDFPRINKPKVAWQGGFRKYLKVLLPVTLIFIFPYLIAGISLIAFKSGVTNIKDQHFESANNSFKVSRSIALSGKNISQPLSAIPLLGFVYSPSYDISSAVFSGSEIGSEMHVVFQNATDLFDKVFGDSPYDIKPYTSELSLGLDDLYRRISFLEGEIKASKVFKVDLFKRYIESVDIDSVKEGLLSGKTVVDRMPELLGDREQKKYLIVFQNNMELRPTGGFIGSFAIVHFEKGRMTNIDVQDVYAADGQLKGHVEPPKPIREVLGEANWYLRDSNWDPDFPTSAKRIEWFLEKEIDVKVDGVISIDLAVAKELVKITGPVTLTDFNTQINYDNLYEKTQLEVENNFFPGSYKKANFLSALTQQLITEITSLEGKNIYPLGETLLSLLGEKHIQLFVHDREVQKVISSQGYSGEVYIPKCTGNCQADFFGLVDANLGVNKSNYFVERSVGLDTKFDQGFIDKKLSIVYKNNAGQGMGLTGVYKNFLRIIVPKGAVSVEAYQLSGETRMPLDVQIDEMSEREELGLLLEVLPSQKKTVVVSWRLPSVLDFTSQGEYRLYVRKQSGTDEDTINLTYSPPYGLKVNTWPSFALTRSGFYVYNTNLARDLFVRLGW